VSKQEVQLRRVALISALVVVLAGGTLMVAPALLSSAAPAPRNSDIAIAAGSVSPAMAASAPPLPTIARPASARATSSAVAEQASPSSIGTDTSAGSSPAGAAAHLSSNADSQLTGRLVAHLSCIQPGAHHDPELDARAAELARQDDTPLPTTGVIQVVGNDVQHILISADALADLRTAGGRCGETLIFGVPPLDWLLPKARFGLAVVTRSAGALVVVTTRR
jgi:hypothetical protein